MASTKITSVVNFTDYVELTLENGTTISIEKASIRFEWNENDDVFIVDSNDRVYQNKAENFTAPTGTAQQIYDVLNTYRSLSGSPSGDVGVAGIESAEGVNSSTVPLGANLSFEGTAEDVTNYSKITVTVSSDVSSAPFGWLFQISDDGITWQVANGFTTPFEPINGVFGSAHQLTVVKKYFRVLYLNGAIAQTSFSIKTFYHTASSMRLVGTFDRFVDGTEDINYVISRGIGEDPYGNFKTIGTDAMGDLHVNIQEPSSSYGDIIVAESTAIIQEGFPYNVNDSLFNKEITGTGSISQANDMAVISTGASSTSRAKMSTINTIKFREGQGGDVIVSGRFTLGAANSTQLLGVGTSENGLFIGYNGTEFGVFRITDNVINFTAQTAFNLDVLDGSKTVNQPNDPNPSGILLDPTKGNEYKISIHQGFGTVTFSLVADPVTGKSYPFEQLVFANTENSPLLYNNTFPLIAEVENTTNATDITLYVQSLAGFISGKDIIKGALRSQENNAIVLTAATQQSLFILRGRSSFNGVMNCVKNYLRYISLSYPQQRFGTLRILRNPTFTTVPSYTDLDTSNSTIEYDLTTRDVSANGEVIAVRQAPRQAAGYDVEFENINEAPFFQPNDVLAITFEIDTGASIDASYGILEDL